MSFELPNYGNPILDYWEQIKQGKVVVCKKVRRVYQKLAYDLAHQDGRWVYDERKANKVLTFLEKFCKQSKGAAGGDFLKLELWQRAYVAATFGFVDRETGLRKYQESMLIIAVSYTHLTLPTIA